MREEVLRILRMVEEGKLNAQEAERLLSALETLRAPGAGVGISFDRKPNAEFVEKELPGRDDFNLSLSASKAELFLWDEDRVKLEAWVGDLGFANETPSGLALNMARARIHLPSGRSLRLDVSAGKAKGDIPAVANITCAAGKAELRGLREGTVSCSAGKVEILLSPEPGPLSLEVNAGKIEILVPGERKMRIIREDINAGGVQIDGRIEDPSAPPATIRCSAGKISIRKG